ncbi:MAG: AAA family ATPase [Flavobacteriaceae bacterium]|nr:AAA family ATPase [Flavobacteriaceae bacterium]
MIKTLGVKELKGWLDYKAIDWRGIKADFPSKPLIGQERALKALEFGTGNKSNGFNIYVSGYPGSGKLKAIKYFLEKRANLEPSPGDWCYVNNFNDPYYPKKLKLPQGGAVIFKNEINIFIEEARDALIKAFESKEYADRKEELITKFHQKEIELFKEIHAKAKANNFTIKRTPIELIVLPLDEEGVPLLDKKFQKLEKRKKEEILKKQNNLKEELISLLRKNREIERERNSFLIKLEEKVALYSIESLLEELMEKYNKFNDVLNYLGDIKRDIIENLDHFLNGIASKDQTSSIGVQGIIKYEVNVVTDNSKLDGSPIVIEQNPTYNNLFGKVEHESQMGTLLTNFTLIRSGSLHKANGGYLVIPLKELLMNYFSWDGLKRALKNNEIIMEDASERLGFLSAKSLKPDPIPLDVQIILIGSPQLYYLLFEYDEDFRELFKVKAEFDTTMDFTIENVKDFAKVIYKLEKENSLIPVSDHGMVSLLEHSSRMANDRNKISIKFREIKDIMIEADHYAKLNKAKEVSGDLILKSVNARYYRSNLIQEKINELIKRNKIMIDFKDSKIGQINGISVLDLGDITFGKPNKITVSIASGKEGLVDIEREAKLGGSIHTKGVLIILGYLYEKYAQNKPISLKASLVFEQSYSEIEGDSASSAELYAILSSLSKLPINQGIAVTGSINQKGEIQPVGAINEKIEGYFEACKQVGLTGDQGVLIPIGNRDNLMLKQEVIHAVKDGLFKIWAVKTIDEGIEILTGIPSGKRLKNGSFSKSSVHFRVDQRIDELNKNLRQYSETK